LLKIEPIIIRHGNYIDFYNLKNYVPFEKRFNLLFFGLIKESKGLDVLLESLVILRNYNINFNLTIAGRPWKNDFANYQRIIDDNNLNDYISTHLHFIPEKDLIKYFENCDLVILPYREIFQSGVLLKAMSLKRAVLCSSLPAFEELILDNYNGYIFESGNPLSLADTLRKISNQSNNIIDVVDVAYQTIKRDFSWSDIGFRLTKLYKNI
jgi:glycosyltransferase involved in cell wall biosynthesis